MILRDGMLAGVRVSVAGPAGPFGDAVRERVAALGAIFLAPAEVLVVDAAALFAGARGVEAVRAALDGGWDAVRPAGTEMHGGRIVLLAPPPGDAHADAARGGLENLARTLSVEWSRFGIRPVAILPGTATSPAEVAELVAFLASPAGEYYAGCAFTLGAVVT